MESGEVGPIHKFPFKMEKLPSDIQEEVSTFFEPFKNGNVLVGPEKWFLPHMFAEHIDELYNFEARHDDVLVCSYPRAGSTWVKEMIWLICHNLDFDTAKSQLLKERVPFFE